MSDANEEGPRRSFQTTIRLGKREDRPPIKVQECEITVLDGPDRDRVFRMHGSVLRVGKGQENEVVLTDQTISRAHLVIEERQGRYLVRDLGSTNGTTINGLRTAEACIDAEAILVIGSTTLKLTPHRTDLPDKSAESSSFAGLIGDSTPMRELFGYLERVSPTDLSVLLIGETGTGKEMVARAIHESSSRSSGPFVVFDAASCEPELLGASLFGHREGAFTGAKGHRKGAFLSAHQGTLFIDEIGELPLEVQPKLLRALELRQIQPLGSDQPVRVDVRVVSATHRQVEELVEQQKFREDLFFRLAGLVLELPALRDRPGDITLLARHLATRARPPRLLSSGAIAALEAYPWPGNVRELKNVLDRATALFPDVQIEASHLMMGRVRMGGAKSPPSASSTREPVARSLDLPAPKAPVAPAPVTLEEVERVAILAALQAAGGNKSRAARSLGISRQTLRDKLERYGIRSGHDD
ncbi:MAG: sigma 54-dependent Fis family transcriptional regulator [Candidatus Riflebacteria bacterium]|nr:sigma 54-dependent Fis family transcriptional regulator [Candidatus Riflebacteria bacterium]